MVQKSLKTPLRNIKKDPKLACPGKAESRHRSFVFRPGPNQMEPESLKSYSLIVRNIFQNLNLCVKFRKVPVKSLQIKNSNATSLRQGRIVLVLTKWGPNL